MEQKEYLNNLRHSCAHLLAAAVLELYPGTKRGIGPSIENGFYFDFEFPQPISEEDLPKIEEKMHEILKTWDKFTQEEVTPEEAKKRFAHEPYKLQLIDEFAKSGQKLTIYKSGNYEDLCKGGHSDNPKKDIGACKLLSLAGAYWRGSEKNPMLTRIYGTCFPTQRELDEYSTMLEETKKRDHKKLGPQLELFMFHETAPGMPYWLPKGVILYNQLIKFWREEHEKAGYQEIISPLLNKKDLYVTSGHFEHYWEHMFVADMGEHEVYGVKAMNCPNAMIVFGSKTRSYKDLPLRFSDTDPLHRYELSGTLNGLLRVRQFRQDDAHIFVTASQIKDEYTKLFALTERFYSIFGLEYSFRLGTRPDEFMGEKQTWDQAEEVLKEILKESNKPYDILEGDGAFYGPKIDILMKDCLDREWQTGTLQLDFQQPSRFHLTYISKEGRQETPIAIHRVIYGSLERFIGILIEHYNGAFPLWLSPLQVVLLPIADRHNDYAAMIQTELKNNGMRVAVDTRGERLQAKIRHTTLQKVPYLGIIGDKEAHSGDSRLVSIRTQQGEDLGQRPIAEFIQKLVKEIDKKV